MQQTVLDAANPVVNYYPNPNGYRDIGSGLSITAADLSGVSATVAEGKTSEQYVVELMMDSSKPEEKFIQIVLTVLAEQPFLCCYLTGAATTTNQNTVPCGGAVRIPPG